jgi:hypothetical protein
VTATGDQKSAVSERSRRTGDPATCGYKGRVGVPSNTGGHLQRHMSLICGQVATGWRLDAPKGQCSVNTRFATNGCTNESGGARGCWALLGWRSPRVDIGRWPARFASMRYQPVRFSPRIPQLDRLVVCDGDYVVYLVYGLTGGG